MQGLVLFLIMVLSQMAFAGESSVRQEQRLQVAGETWTLTVPPGMRHEVLTDRLDKPRLLTFLPNGDLLSGSRAGKVYRLRPVTINRSYAR